MTKDYKTYSSIDAALKETGFKAWNILNNDLLDYELSRVAVDKARGLYDAVAVIPGELVLAGTGWMPINEVHVLYVVPSTQLKTERRPANQSIQLTYIEASNARGDITSLNI